jgi:hypothetical protein
MTKVPHQARGGRPVGRRDNKPDSEARRAAGKRTGALAQGPGRWTDAQKEMQAAARAKGVSFLVEGIDMMLEMARDREAAYFERQAAIKFIADRCGLPVRQETELDVAGEIPITLVQLVGFKKPGSEQAEE